MTEYRDVVGFICNLSISFLTSIISIIFLAVPTLKLRIVIIVLPTDRPDAILPTVRTTKN